MTDSHLRRELFIVAASGCALSGLFFSSLYLYRDYEPAPQALLQSLLLWTLVWQQGWSLRLHNRIDATATLLPTLGNANRLTLLRGWLIAACGGFLLLPSESAGVAPALCYSLAAILDRLDGYVARRSGNVTLLGSELDTRIDAIGLLVAPLLAVGYGKLHASYLVVSVAYYLFVGGLHWRRINGKRVLPLRPSRLRRTLAGMQMGFVAFALWPQLQPALTQLCGTAFMVPLLFGFVVDWLVVSDRLPSQSAIAERNFRLVETTGEVFAKPLLRFALVAALWFNAGPLQTAPSESIAASFPLLLISVCLLCGIAGRICAVAALLLVNVSSGAAAVNSTTELLAPLLAVWVLLFGTGRFSAWQADSNWVNRQDGG